VPLESRTHLPGRFSDAIESEPSSPVYSIVVET
jgi:hypothetical protein